MKRFTFLIGLILIQATIAEAGWMDNLKSRAQGAVNQKVREAQQDLENSVREQAGENTSMPNQAPAKSSTGSVKDKNKLELYGGHSAPWNVAPSGSTKVQDVEIKGLRLGMPEVLVDEILTKEGFEKTGLTSYSKELVEINGKQVEVTRSQQTGKSANERGTLIKRYIVQYKAVKADDALLEELEDPLKGMIKKGKKKLQEIKDKYARQQTDSRLQRGSGTRPQYDRYPVDTSAFKLVYEIEYRQAFAHGSQFDQPALMGQIKGIFGEPTYAPESTHARNGSAFGTNEASWLIYHDAALVPVEKREALLEGVEKKGDRWAMKNGFSHPCGASPYENKMNCVNTPLSVAYPDLGRRLDAARILYAPVMMVNFQSPVITTKLAWEYIKSAPSIRGYFNKNQAYKALPKAQAEF